MRFLGGGIGHIYLRELERELPGFLPGVDRSTGSFTSNMPDDEVEQSPSTEGNADGGGDDGRDNRDNDHNDHGDDGNDHDGDSDESGDCEDDEDDGDEGDEGEEEEHRDSEGSEGDEQGSGTLEGDLGFGTL